MRYDSFPHVIVAAVACLYACQASEYDTEATTDVSTDRGGSTAASGSHVGATGGRIGSVTGSDRSASGGNSAPLTHADSLGGASTASARSGQGGMSDPAGGASAAAGTSSSLTHADSLGGASNVGAKSGQGGMSNPTGGASAAAGTSSSIASPAGGSRPTSSVPQPDPTNGTEFSPYFYTWGWGNSAYSFSDLQDLRTKTALKSVTLAFVLSDGQCFATTDIRDHVEDVNAFRNSGGHVKASFGGANGTYLENACTDVQSLATAIRNFVTATNVTDLDFDVEQASAMDATVNERRAQALKLLQTEKGIAVSLTLAATPRDKWGTLGGLSAASLGVVRAMLDAEVKLTRVNVMAMDYGTYFSSGNSMGALAISALTDTLTQLKSLLPGLSDAELWHLLGATPMIGQNDVASEVFSLDDARTLVAFAKEKNLGLVSFWAINRDQPCPYNSLAVCSQVNTRTFEFSEIFALAE